jgi:hypothetical protein
MEASDQLHVITPLPPWKEPSIHIKWEAGWTPEPVWTLWRMQKPRTPTRNQGLLSRPPDSLVGMLTELSLIPGSFLFCDISTNNGSSVIIHWVIHWSDLLIRNGVLHLDISYKDIMAIKLQRKVSSWCISPDIVMLLCRLEKMPVVKIRVTWDFQVSPLQAFKVL